MGEFFLGAYPKYSGAIGAGRRAGYGGGAGEVNGLYETRSISNIQPGLSFLIRLCASIFHRGHHGELSRGCPLAARRAATLTVHH